MGMGERILGGGALIEARGIVKSFGSREVLRGINLEIKKGEFVALLGANGAGKSTLLRILSLQWPATAGSVKVEGQPGREAGPEIRGKIGVLSHQTLLYDTLTAEENLLFYGRVYGVSGLADRVLEVLEQVGLEYALRDQVRTFSRGMQQRLAIARTILHDPKIIFLDEPFTGLDQRAAATLQSVLQQLKNNGKTMFMITHSFDLGLNITDRLVFLDGGRLIHEVSPAAVPNGDFKGYYLEQVEDK